MRIRQLRIFRFRGLDELTFEPGARTVVLGPQNAGKSTILEALDLLLHHGFGRPRQAPTEIDYYHRSLQDGFEVEAVLGNLTNEFAGDVREHLEGWIAASKEVVAEPDGPDIEPIVRVRARGTSDFSIVHEFAKPESNGAHFNPARRIQVGWVFDGRTRDPLQQLSFYQGGLLERLFSEADLDPATAALRDSLGEGAQQVNSDNAIATVLSELASELHGLGLLQESEVPGFEAGAISQRQLLQSLRLALPVGETTIPLSRQGRGVQRLVLVSVLLRLARAAATGQAVIGGFEEPEEALEPLRQAQIAGMLVGIAEKGGQVFVVTHSPEIARRFEIDDFLLLQERGAGRDACALRSTLTAPVRQTYERRLDGAVVRGLFSKVPVLVEGPGDRAVFDVFWWALAQTDRVPPAEQLGIDVINCEGAPSMPMLATLLNLASKNVVAWTERDTQDVQKVLERLRSEGHCAALLLYGTEEGKRNLEEALTDACSLEALALGMQEIASDRGYEWQRQQSDLISRCSTERDRERVSDAKSVPDLVATLDPAAARRLIASALSSRTVAPFDLKGGRQSRIFSTAIVDAEGVPEPFASGFERLANWIRNGCESGCEIEMWVESDSAGS